MDSLLTVYLPQSIQPSAHEARRGCGHLYLTWHHVVEEFRREQFHYGTLAVRIYLFATCLVSLWYGTPARHLNCAPFCRHRLPSLTGIPTRPIACTLWLLLAMILLLLTKESIIIYNPADPSITYTILGLMALPYTVTSDHPFLGRARNPALPRHNTDEEMGVIPTQNHRAETPGQEEEEMEVINISHLSPVERRRRGDSSSSKTPMMTGTQRRDTVSLPSGSNCVTIRITMPSSFGWRSWRWYEAVIETMAVGIYLYATFVLTSLLFLNADKAIAYATVMAICLSVVRILTVLF